MERLPSRRNLHVEQRKLGNRDRLMMSLEKVLDSFIVLKEF